MRGSSAGALGLEMVRIEAGEFRMGSVASPAKWDEQPVHRVRIGRPFWMSGTEVTVEQFRRFRPDFAGTEDCRPYAAGVSWYDAVAFCEWLSEMEGETYRLPTEAEWEYACLAGRKDSSSFADDVGKADSPNPWGLKSMLSGVREWCLDWYGEYSGADQTDPVGPGHGFARVVRGGGLDDESPLSEWENYARPSNRAGVAPGFGHAPGAPNDFGKHGIGFRVVKAPAPASEPAALVPSYLQQGVRQTTDHARIGPDPGRPHYRKRHLLPTPPENTGREAIDAAGLHPSIRWHNHSPGFEVCPNGDLLLVIYTASYREYEPEVSLIGSRLRFGADQWDMPAPFLGFPNANNHAPLLWNDGGALHLFWGNPRLQNAFPFQWTSSEDNGATWSEVRFPGFRGDVGAHSRQPINTAFRGQDGTMYVASDAVKGSSVLWASSDNGRTWYDTGGRSAGRHTTYAMLNDGSILGMGGKNTEIEGYMPAAISRDGGKSWEREKSPFCKQASNQRPSILRLQSGRLFFACDLQERKGFQPEGFPERGALVALSDDEGQTWHIKKLVGAQEHESDASWGATIGYSAARQAPNGVIHLITTMNSPCLHFEMNEAWILDRAAEVPCDADLLRSKATEISDLEDHEERYPDGRMRVTWSAGTANDGRYLLHGTETWYHPNGSRQREAAYRLGCKVGVETYRSSDGKTAWTWEHGDDGHSRWTQYWPNGRKKAESTWRDFKCDGVATRYDPSGTLIGKASFRDGELVSD